MAKSDAVWGIDVGQCALKALRCRADQDNTKLLADAFDYIEYPKILSQPGSDPAELIGNALKQFLSRNSVKGDRVAISVSGQAGLARFIKLPPVEIKKIPDIVRFEARQQIPFDLNDVIWDYQRMGIGAEEEGFALETEIGLFAMKREAVFRTLEPFQKAGIEVDFVQLTPLALYNFALFDQLDDLPPPAEYDPENPPESIVLISLGTDATDLVVTNGYRVWQRSVPLGGNHFTKALTKELKLTFAKAEHLKRNAASAQDPKAVFQAMRPVFNDLLTELQRSIGYFTSLDRAAKIKRVLALGNAIKLPGLRRYLSQSLGYEIERLESFGHLVGPQVLSAPAFKENALCFGACYGLALQGLAKGGLRTNLLPKEILKDRLIIRKKPWAVAAAAVLLLACGISFTSYSLGLTAVDAKAWSGAEGTADDVARKAQEFKTGADDANKQLEDIRQVGTHLVGNVEGRILWLELLKAVNQCLPQALVPADKPQPQELKERSKREEMFITGLECRYVPDLSQWFAAVKSRYQPGPAEAAKPADPAAASAAANGAAPAPAGAPAGAAAPAGAPATGAGDTAGTAAAGTEGPTGAGWLIVLKGYHYHNDQNFSRLNIGAEYVRRTLIHNLHTMKMKLPSGQGGAEEMVSVKDLGIAYPVLVTSPDLWLEELVDPNIAPADAAGAVAAPAPATRPPAAPALGGEAAPGTVGLWRLDFEVQFCWKPTPPSERHEKQKAAQENKSTSPGQP